MAGAKPKLVFWKPGLVVRAAQVYLDANFLVALAWPEHIWHASATGLSAAMQARGTRLILSSLAFNEAIYQLIKLAEKEQSRRSEAAGFDNGAELNWHSSLDRAVAGLATLDFFEPANISFQRQVIRAVRDLNLDPTDAFHYAAAARLNCPIVTNDVGFQKLPDANLTVVTFF